MSLGKQLKNKLLDRFNKTVLPLMSFKCRIGNRYSQKFSGEVKMDKLKLYNPFSYNGEVKKLTLVVDVTVKGIVLTRKCYRDENEIFNMINSNQYLTSYSTTSQIVYTGEYENKDKKHKSNMTSKIKYAIEDQINDNIKVMSIKEALKDFGLLTNIKIGKIKYE